MRFALLILAFAANLACADLLPQPPEAESEIPLSPRKWIEHWHVLKDKLDSAIPAPIRAELKKAAPSFCAFPLDEHFESAYAQGDFNCDGKPDYAIVGIQNSDPLAAHFCSSNAHTELSDAEVTKTKALIDGYMLSRPGTVWIALSQSKGGRTWFQENGSQIRYSEGDCGCCTRTPKKQRQSLKAKHCGFLYIGCCENTGRYLLYKKNSTQVQMRDACQ